jgi:hypothetical protein
MKSKFQQFIRNCLYLLAVCLPKNRGKQYPQLWYYMPGRYRQPKVKQYCCVCGELIKGTPAMSKNQANWPASLNWCDKCLDMQDMLSTVENMLHGPQGLQSIKGSGHSEPFVNPERRLSWYGCWLRPTLQWLCGILSGHELSETEWGYGGGKMVDRNCRWCDKTIHVPMAESPAPNRPLQDLTREGFGVDPESGKPL